MKFLPAVYWIFDTYLYSGWKVFFELLWPRYADKVLVIQNNINRHKLLFDSEVTLQNIGEAHEERSRVLKEYEENRKFREQQQFEAAKTSLAPQLYYADLEGVLETCYRGTGGWILNQTLVQDWSDPDKKTVPLLWLSGIPGAGKIRVLLWYNSSSVNETHRQNPPICYHYSAYDKKET